jgi:hypothetical protein
MGLAARMQGKIPSKRIPGMSGASEMLAAHPILSIVCKKQRANSLKSVLVWMKKRDRKSIAPARSPF